MSPMPCHVSHVSHVSLPRLICVRHTCLPYAGQILYDIWYVNETVREVVGWKNVPKKWRRYAFQADGKRIFFPTGKAIDKEHPHPYPFLFYMNSSPDPTVEVKVLYDGWTSELEDEMKVIVQIKVVKDVSGGTEATINYNVGRRGEFLKNAGHWGEAFPAVEEDNPGGSAAQVVPYKHTYMLYIYRSTHIHIMYIEPCRTSQTRASRGAPSPGRIKISSTGTFSRLP